MTSSAIRPSLACQRALPVSVLYVLSHGFSARMILHSGVLEAVQGRGVRMGILAPAGQTGTIVEALQGTDCPVYPLPKDWVRRSKFGELVRPYLYEDVRRNPALWSKHRAAAAPGRRRALLLRCFYLLNRATSRCGPLRQALIRRQRNRLVNDQLDAMMRQLSPQLVVSTYPVNDLEAAVIAAAQRQGVLTVGHLLSWDNITSKGRWLVVPDAFIAWGPIMAEELARYYGVDGERVVCTGVPHFDVHVREVTRERIATALRSLGLTPGKPYLFWGMSSPVFAPTEIDLIEWLASKVEANAFGPEVQLVVRPHPQNVEGYMADTSWLPRLERLRSQRVGINYPLLIRGGLPWSLEREDLVILANLVGGCAVCLNSGSTLSIDAIVQDRPVVLPLFDWGPPRPWHLSVRRVAEYTHQRTMLALGGVSVAENLEQLESAIHAYLVDPTLHAEGRQRVRDRELAACDGKAAERVVAALKHFAENCRAPRQV